MTARPERKGEAESGCRLLPGEAGDIVLLVHESGRILEANQAAAAAYGYGEAELSSLSLHDLCALQERRRSAGEAVRAMTYETVHRKKDGETFPVEISEVAMEAGGQWVQLTLVRDITGRKQHEEHLLRMATQDALTGLPNRRIWEERLGGKIDAACGGAGGALMILDLDDFKSVNDTMGHAAGDRLLVEVSARMAGALRRGDLLARLGGDEFGVIMEAVTPEEALLVAGRIRQAVEACRFYAGGRSFNPTVSIGLAPFDGAFSRAAVLKQADRALYAAKAQGKNRAVVGLGRAGQVSLLAIRPAVRWRQAAR
ncbi:MAG TPA: sensor domain-containing diguanylate cyclase [Symbiobacteriaceae bacterium]|jgi:diguanylate cyclase (GGDEF)-like protein/PAS domain S-box-containing protein